VLVAASDGTLPPTCGCSCGMNSRSSSSGRTPRTGVWAPAGAIRSKEPVAGGRCCLARDGAPGGEFDRCLCPPLMPVARPRLAACCTAISYISRISTAADVRLFGRIGERVASDSAPSSTTARCPAGAARSTWTTRGRRRPARR
jgi:hypothetical protein